MPMFRQLNYSVPPALGQADAGNYFVALNAAPGTPLNTIAAQATFSDLAPLVFVNAGAKGFWLDYLRIYMTTVGAGPPTAVRFAAQISNNKANPTGGGAIAKANVNGGSALGSACSVFAGDLTAVASGAPRLITSAILRPVAPVVGDIYQVSFGAPQNALPDSLAPGGAAIATTYHGAPPCILSNTGINGNVLQLHLWFPGQTGAASFEMEMGWWEF